MGKLARLVSVADGLSCSSGLALTLILTPQGRVLDDRIVARDRTAWQWMVPSLMCALSSHVLLAAKTLLGAWSCHGIWASKMEGLAKTEVRGGR